MFFLILSTAFVIDATKASSHKSNNEVRAMKSSIIAMVLSIVFGAAPAWAQDYPADIVMTFADDLVDATVIADEMTYQDILEYKFETDCSRGCLVRVEIAVVVDPVENDAHLVWVPYSATKRWLSTDFSDESDEVGEYYQMISHDLGLGEKMLITGTILISEIPTVLHDIMGISNPRMYMKLQQSHGVSLLETIGCNIMPAYNEWRGDSSLPLSGIGCQNHGELIAESDEIDNG